MALSVLGLRVRVFDGGEEMIRTEDLSDLLVVFDALVDAPLAPAALSAAIDWTETKFLVEAPRAHSENTPKGLPPSRTTVLAHDGPRTDLWQPLCALLGLTTPAQSFPVGAPRTSRLFRDDRIDFARQSASDNSQEALAMDDSPWVLPAWRSTAPSSAQTPPPAGKRLLYAEMTTPSPSFRGLVETFPGNEASFVRDGLVHNEDGAQLEACKSATATRPYRSGAFASVRSFQYGRFEAEIKAASGSGLVTGFFLHRDAPRQEIDVELSGNDPYRMLVNVFFNPGDDGAALCFGYRGSPCRIDLGFDSTVDFHLYAIDWRPTRIVWLVDDRIVHERVGWDPTPIPHLPMRLHANLWLPRSKELAGQLDDDVLPATATFKNVSVQAVSQ